MLREAIESVLAQTYQDWELIIVDDGSTDETRCFVQRYREQDSRVRYVYRQNGGLPAARNTGLRIARGRYVAFLDDDDLLLPSKLEHQVHVLKTRRELGFVYAPVIEVHDNRPTTKLLPTRLGRTMAELFEGSVPQVHSALVRRSSLDVVGEFSERLRHCHDYDLWLRLASRFPFDYLTQTVGICRRHRTNMSRKLVGLLGAQLTILQSITNWRALGVTASARRRRLARLAYELARLHFDAREYLTAGRYFLKAVVWRPDIGMLASEYRAAVPQSLLRKLIKPYAGIGYCFYQGLLHVNR